MQRRQQGEAGAVFKFDAVRRARLHKIVSARSFQEGGRFVLASGGQSALYFEMKATMLDPEGAYLVAHAVGEKAVSLAPDYLGGLAMGAVPIAASVSALSYAAGQPLRTFFIRKKDKKHGARRRVEGLCASESLKDAQVVVIEDVTTTGGSALRAVEIISELGGAVRDLITLVDREEGASAMFAQRGIALHSIFRASDFSAGGR